jgi:peptidyl-prolyl cis-trans isomerase B (cyclophilin B)
LLAFKKELVGIAEFVPGLDTVDLPKTSSTPSTPMSPQQLLIQGISQNISVTGFSGLAVITVIVLVVLYMAKRKRVYAKLDEKN